MNATTNRATYQIGNGRELINLVPRHYAERAKENERQWRRNIALLKRRVTQDSRELEKV